MRVKWTCPACEQMCGDAARFGDHLVESHGDLVFPGGRDISFRAGESWTGHRPPARIKDAEEFAVWFQDQIERVGFDKVQARMRAAEIEAS